MPVRIGIVLLLLSLPLVSAAQSDTPRGNEIGLLKARIAQLEAMTAQLRAQADVCGVQVRMPAIEKEAGCVQGLDMTTVPPVCKSSAPTHP